MVRYLARFITFLCVFGIVASCRTPTGTTSLLEKVSESSCSPDAGIVAIQELMDTAVADRRIPSAIAMLALGDQIRWIGTAGEMTAGIPMRDDAILPLASVGKMFTATAAMILYERGVIALDDPVSKYIPEFTNAMVAVDNDEPGSGLVEAERPITVFHLLTHTGGLTVTGDQFWATWDKHVGKTTTTHFARDLVKLPLHAQPGDSFWYGQTGASYEVLGAVIEIASGQTLETFMSENIFVPLRLNDTYFYLPETKAMRLPEIYRRVDDRLQLDRQYGEDFSRSTFFHGGGGVRSAPADIHRFARLFLEGGSVDGTRILEADTVALMMRDHLGDKSHDHWKARGVSWGFGATVRHSLDHTHPGVPDRYGWVGGGFAKLWIDPKKQLIAYMNFPLTPPGDNDLLAEFEELVDASACAHSPAPATSL